MMLTIGKSYTRRSPDGVVSEVEIKDQKGLEYHRDLQDNHGYVYEAKLRIHKRLEECESCSS